ncbi:MAG: FliH/SctL family protein [Phycisphaerales bacterium]
MGLIRQKDATTLLPDAVVLDLGDLARQGDALIARARAQADRIVSEARAERDRLLATASADGRARGLEEGHREGLEKGSAQGRQEALVSVRARAAEVGEGWGGCLERFERAREEMCSAVRDELVRFAVAFAERVTRRAIALDARAIEPIMEEAIGLVVGCGKIAVRISGEDMPLAREILGDVLDRIGCSDGVELVEDASLSHGSCVVRTESGSVDATVETMIGRMSALLLPDGVGRDAALDAGAELDAAGGEGIAGEASAVGAGGDGGGVAGDDAARDESGGDGDADDGSDRDAGASA